MLITTTLTACNETEDSIPQVAKNRLKITVGVNQPQSRAIITGNVLPDASEIGIRLEGYDGITNTKFTAATQDGKQVWNPESDIVLNSTAGTLYAYYPYKAGTDLSAIAVSTDTQTDYLYATPVGSVSEDKASVPVSMNHMLSNVNITINRGTYVGTGNITNITVYSDGFATGGTFNAAQATPGFTSVTGTGDAIAQAVTATLDGTATDIMVVPTGTAKAVTFTATIDGVDYTATSSDVELEEGKSYEYTLSLNSTFMSTESVSVKTWTGITKESLTLEKVNPWLVLPNGVYAVAADGSPVEVANATSECIAVALVQGPHKFMIEKNETNNAVYNGNISFYWEYSCTDLSLTNYTTADGTNSIGYLPKADGTYQSTPNLSGDFTTWTSGVLSDFNGKTNTDVIVAASSNAKDMGTILKNFNAAADQYQGYNDWYIPAFGQLALMYLNMTDINAALTQIGGVNIFDNYYWSSSECDYDSGWFVYINSGGVANGRGKNFSLRVRFVRDI